MNRSESIANFELADCASAARELERSANAASEAAGKARAALAARRAEQARHSRIVAALAVVDFLAVGYLLAQVVSA